MFNCNGTEMRLSDCPSTMQNTNIGCNEYAGVVCSKYASYVLMSPQYSISL